MDNITNTMTAERMSQSPSYFGMPACGHAARGVRWTSVCHRYDGVKGDMGLAPVYRHVPGYLRLEPTDELRFSSSAASRPRNPTGIRGLCVSRHQMSSNPRSR